MWHQGDAGAHRDQIEQHLEIGGAGDHAGHETSASAGPLDHLGAAGAAARRQERQAGQATQGQRFRRRQRVVSADGHADGIAEQLAALEERVEGAGQQVILVADGHVDVAAQDRGQRFLRLHLGQAEVHLRRGSGQRRPGGRHESGGGGREGGHGDLTGYLVAQRGQVGFGRVQLGQQGVGVGDQDDGSRGEADPPALAFGEPHPDLALERGELLGDGGRRVAERGRGRRDRAVRADRVQHPKPTDIKHEAELSSHRIFCN